MTDADTEMVEWSVMRYEWAIDDCAHGIADVTGVDRRDLRLLDVLLSEPEDVVTPGVLSGRLGTSSSDTAEALSRLQRAGYLELVTHPSANGRVIVRPTTKAVDGDLTIIDSARAVAGSLAHRFSADERAVISDFLRRATTVHVEQLTRLRHAQIVRPGAAGTPSQPKPASHSDDERPRSADWRQAPN